jgi:dTDP-4-amino-4,6-dideoxygalactose transaminase
MNHGRDNVYIRIDDDREQDRAALFEVVNGRFSFVRLGHSFRATEMEAAVGVAQLEERHELCARRRDIAARYDEELADLERWIQLPRGRPDSEHAYMFYAVVVTDPDVDRDDLVMHLEERSIETRHLLPLINQPVYRKLFGDLDAEYPVAARLNENAFYVGSHPEMTDDDVTHVIASFRSFGWRS